MTLWSPESLEKGRRETPQHNSEFEIVASESINDKISALNVSASLKASFLSGLVELDGSAKYLSDCKSSKNQARVTLKYKTTTKFQELSMDHLGWDNVKYPDVFDKGIATHVVIGVLYGAQAFFVFDQEVSEKEDCQNIEGHLRVMIKKIPSITIDGHGALQMSDKDISNDENFSCKFYGDFSLEKNPVSFQDAIQVYQSLPTLLGAKKENVVPLKIWLMPLNTLDSSAAQFVRQISISLVSDAQSILEDFSELELRCNDALKNQIAQQFPQIGKKLKIFRQQCAEYKLQFQKTLADKLPSIRGGGEEESVLAEFLKTRHSSPFTNINLSEWLNCKEREINIIQSLTDMLKNIKIVTTPSALDKEIFYVEHAVCFVFTSLEHPDPLISALSHYLRETSSVHSSRYNELYISDVKKDQWYYSKEILEEMRQKAKLFLNFAEDNKNNTSICFLATAIPNDTQRGAVIQLYENGSLVNNNFNPPSNPETILAIDISHNSVTVKMFPPRFGTENVTHYSVEYCVKGENAWQQKTASMDGVITVSTLIPNTEYLFRSRAVCSTILGPARELCGSAKTLPTSPPGKPHVEACISELLVTWEKPEELGEGVHIEKYILEYAKTSSEVKLEDLPWIQIHSESNQTVISDLQPLTEYAARVTCDCGAAGRSKNSIEVIAQTTKREFEKLADLVKHTSKLIHSASPSVHKLHLEKTNVEIEGCKGYSFGRDSVRRNRTIMVLGTTGAGKSTLINGMINYILGVKWEDAVRFKLVDENESQVESQTSEVSMYKINHQEGFTIPYTLTIVDIPGFGDTWKIERDRMITEQLRNLFSDKLGVSEIDAVCFVAQACLARLSPTQKYVFDSVLSILGKDVADNIRILVTFADVQQPPVLQAINVSGVPCPKNKSGFPVHFKFNNSALFANSKLSCLDGQFDKMFWDMSTKSMNTFFAALNTMTTRSLSLTKKVLRERNQQINSVYNSAIDLVIGPKRLAEAIIAKSQLLERSGLNVYSIPLENEHMNVNGCNRFSFGQDTCKNNRTIMVLGATGAGKSTLINGMINYILGVKWEDAFRFKLFDENESQAESQTAEVSMYKINHQEGFTIPYSLTIVDTPGFGDTWGIEKDRMITEQLSNLFSDKLGVSEIDAVCFVAQASLARLSPTEKYMFESVLSIFGKHMADNIRILVTFADVQQPPVLQAINESGVLCPKNNDLPVHFKFNNSALFANSKLSRSDTTVGDHDEDGQFDQMFWDMGTKSMTHFFAAMNTMTTRSLSLTKQVLRERKQLENSVENLQIQVKGGLAKLEEIRQTTQILQKHITANEKFEFEVRFKKPVIKMTSHFITSCLQCQMNCHYRLGFRNDDYKRRCAAMGRDGNCTQCPGKCHWNVHFIQKYRWHYVVVIEKRTIKNLKDKYQSVKNKRMSVQDVIKRLEEEYEAVQIEVVHLMEQSANCLDRLKEIALKPNPLSTPEYIDLLIEGEKYVKKPGFMEHIKALYLMREKAEMMAQVEQGEHFLQLNM